MDGSTTEMELLEYHYIPIVSKVGSYTDLLSNVFSSYWKDWLLLSTKKAVHDLGDFYLLKSYNRALLWFLIP